LENLKGRELGRPRHRWEDNIRMDFRKVRNSIGFCGGGQSLSWAVEPRKEEEEEEEG
jgi:hypothetical protein